MRGVLLGASSSTYLSGGKGILYPSMHDLDPYSQSTEYLQSLWHNTSIHLISPAGGSGPVGSHEEVDVARECL